MCRLRTCPVDSGYASRNPSACSSCHGSPKSQSAFFTPHGGFLAANLINASLRKKHDDILNEDEDIHLEKDGFLAVTNYITGVETLFKPPARISFSKEPPREETTFSSEEYVRSNPEARSSVFHSRLEQALEKEVAKKELLEVSLALDSSDAEHPRGLGIRIVGINMVRCVDGMLNIYVKRIIDDSIAGCDGRIHVDDHIVEVNGISLVGVTQKTASETLNGIGKWCSNLEGKVHFVLARGPNKPKETLSFI